LSLSRRAVETLIVTLIAAAVSGLAFVAYKYPLGYRKLAIPLATVIALLSLYGVLWVVGYISSQITSLGDRLKQHPSDSLAEHDYLITAMNQKAALLGKLVVISTLILAYLTLLWFLPSMLGITLGPPVGGA
jgi:nucleoside permease NupC